MTDTNYPHAGYYWVQYPNAQKSTFISRLSWPEGVGTWHIVGHEFPTPFEMFTILEGPLKCSAVEAPPKTEVPTRYARVLDPRCTDQVCPTK